MKYRPILFSTPMVQAILDGRKSMTRRIVKQSALDRFINIIWNPNENICFAPYRKGDILWVRETWQDMSDNQGEYVYFADGDKGLEEKGWGVITTKQIKWKPSIFMPREAARIFLRVTNVRVERVQEITPKDAWEEGCRIGNSFPWEKHIPELQQQCRDILFKSLWDGLNAKRGYGWDINPWVWVYEFERVSEE